MRGLATMFWALTLSTVVGCSAERTLGEPVRIPTTELQSFQPTAGDWQRLQAGERVEYPRAMPGHGPQYIGGIAYQLVDANADEVLRALLDLEQLQRMLPQTKRLEAVGSGHPAPGLELEQGNELMTATYSVVLDHDFQAREVRFWLDRSRPSDIEDVQGFFRVEPAPHNKSLVTVGAALDVGSGLVRFLFDDMIEGLILATPTRVKHQVEASRTRDALAQLPSR